MVTDPTGADDQILDDHSEKLSRVGGLSLRPHWQSEWCPHLRSSPSYASAVTQDWLKASWLGNLTVEAESCVLKLKRRPCEWLVWFQALAVVVSVLMMIVICDYKVQTLYYTFLRDWPSLSDSASEHAISSFHFHSLQTWVSLPFTLIFCMLHPEAKSNLSVSCWKCICITITLQWS